MSKNVAVFVDVANIFYAAKAAGVDIDYVTLLKAATAGRDFVRAYAYTGLDPENENQRQFHAFLARSGYKVVSKDIRKYGDGRIKANLDIELVVDMMRMAEHLDIAVVVSGDGDFAPAIRAVQQMGVRVEVISFRGNTSSDLIEVADVFTDIGQIARVEKGARSGRRVAAEGDLSMTEVPEKETEGPVRRRRGTRRPAEREAVVAEAPDEALPGNVIVLPGERLSRVGTGDEELAEDLVPETVNGAGPAVAAAGAEGEGTEDDGRRRRRRRGGRGRGRGRRPETEALPVAEGLTEDDEFLDETPVALPQHSTFGSVWDSQLGVPSAPRPAATADISDEEEEYEDEPEIPEYLLAERRRQAGRQRGRGRDRGGTYRAALDRERYGRGGAPTYGGGGGGMRVPDRPRGGRDARPQAAPQRGRPPFREQPTAPIPQAPRPAPSAEPWSEVPPEVAELLKAELARRQGRPDAAPAPAEAQEAPQAPPEAAARPAGRSPRVRREAAPVEAGPVEAVAEAPVKRTTRTRKAATAAAEAPSAPEDAAVEAPKRRAPRRTTRAAADTADVAAASDSAPVADEAAAAPAKPRRRTTRKTAEAEQDQAAAASTEAGNGEG